MGGKGMKIFFLGFQMISFSLTLELALYPSFAPFPLSISARFGVFSNPTYMHVFMKEGGR